MRVKKLAPRKKNEPKGDDYAEGSPLDVWKQSFVSWPKNKKGFLV